MGILDSQGTAGRISGENTKHPDRLEGLRRENSFSLIQWLSARGIRRRWLINGIAVVLLIIILAVLIFSFSISRYYYANMMTGLEAKAQTSSEFFTTYVSTTYADHIQSAYRYTATFEDKDKLELQFINTRGRVEVSTYGTASGTAPGTFDVQNAIDTGEISSWSGRQEETGEHIMSVSSPLISNGQVVGVMRYITSLRLVDRQVTVSCLIAVGIGLFLALCILFSNTYFLSSIVVPIRELTVTARSISEGRYGARADKQFDDEIGDLIDTINDMSEKIAKAEKVQSEFISSVSHELRTPLTAITGWSETLLFDTEIQGDLRKGLGIISKEAARLTKMVEELLEFTRMEDGRFNLSVRPIDIASEIEEAIYTYQELLDHENLTLIYKPPAAPLPSINADPERLRQVFLNVLDNASKYGRDGGEIVVDLRCLGSFIEICVRDFGSGIPENELSLVKQKFYKGSSKERGSGIGLSVCEEIMTRHQGALELKNAVGGGLAVTLKFPV